MYATRKTIQRFSLRVKREYGGVSGCWSCSGAGAPTVAFSLILGGFGIAVVAIMVVDDQNCSRRGSSAGPCRKDVPIGGYAPQLVGCHPSERQASKSCDEIYLGTLAISGAVPTQTKCWVFVAALPLSHILAASAPLSSLCRRPQITAQGTSLLKCIPDEIRYSYV